MVDHIGRKIGYGFAIENVRGVAETLPQVWIPHLDADFADKQEKVLNESALGVNDQYNDGILVSEWAEGSFNCKVQSNNFGYLLLAAFGLVETVAGDAPGTYEHTFDTANTNQSQSLTVFKNDPNEEQAFALAVISSMELEFVVGDYVKASCSFISKKGENASLTVLYDIEDEIEFTAKHVNLYVGNYGDTFDAIKGGSGSPVKSIKVTLDRQAETYYETGSVTPYEIHNKAFNATIEIEKRYSDTTYKALAQTDDKKAVVIEAINTDQTIGTGGNPALQLNFPKVLVNDHSTSSGLDDIVEESFTLQGLFDTDTGMQVQAILTNIVEEYVAQDAS